MLLCGPSLTGPSNGNPGSGLRSFVRRILDIVVCGLFSEIKRGVWHLTHRQGDKGLIGVVFLIQNGFILAHDLAHASFQYRSSALGIRSIRIYC